MNVTGADFRRMVDVNGLKLAEVAVRTDEPGSPLYLAYFRKGPKGYQLVRLAAERSGRESGGLDQVSGRLSQEFGRFDQGFGGFVQESGGLDQGFGGMDLEHGGLSQESGGFGQGLGVLGQESGGLDQGFGGLDLESRRLNQNSGGSGNGLHADFLEVTDTLFTSPSHMGIADRNKFAEQVLATGDVRKEMDQHFEENFQKFSS
jgi:hypothetical protein